MLDKKYSSNSGSRAATPTRTASPSSPLDQSQDLTGRISQDGAKRAQMAFERMFAKVHGPKAIAAVNAKEHHHQPQHRSASTPRTNSQSTLNSSTNHTNSGPSA